MSVEHDEPKGNSSNTGKTGSTALESAAKQAEVVKLRLAGLSLDEIATRVGLAGRSGAHYHVTKWIESLQPSTEHAEEYRQTRLMRAEERYRRLRAKSLGEQDPQTGAWIREPDYQALAALQRDEESITKMLGANLEQGVFTPVITREALAKLFAGYDGDRGATPIDADADELPEDDVRELDPPR